MPAPSTLNPNLQYTGRGASVVQTIPVDILRTIWEIEARLRHDDACFKRNWDSDDLQLKEENGSCVLDHCPHDTSPTHTFAFVCKHWYNAARSSGELWATCRVRVMADYAHLTTNIADLRVFNLDEVYCCARWSGTRAMNLSIGEFTVVVTVRKQLMDYAGCDVLEFLRSSDHYRPRRLTLGFSNMLSRMKSLCFDGSNARLVAQLSGASMPQLETVYLVEGREDMVRAVPMTMLGGARFWQSPKLRSVFISCRFRQSLRLSHDITMLTVMDLSRAGTFHEESVEWLLYRGKHLEELRISASLSTTWIGTLPDSSYLLRGPIPKDAACENLRIFHIDHYVSTRHATSTAPLFLTRFRFPILQRLVLRYDYHTHRENVLWLTRANALPCLTHLQLTCDSITTGMLDCIFPSLPSLQELIFSDHKLWGKDVPYSRRDACQDDAFLNSLMRTSRTLKVVKLGGQSFFSPTKFKEFVKHRGMQEGRNGLQLFSMQLWWGVQDQASMENLKFYAYPTVLQCGRRGICPFVAANGERPLPDGNWSDILLSCSECKEEHSVDYDDTEVDAVGCEYEERYRSYFN
ncbi:hypothetical protein NMY22_g2021 [Coprinellus aureogranulatus]|nr:hypothetical protein NMY22_g2021 [Coprinellus aureogranulatus]